MSTQNDLSKIREKISEIEEKSANGEYIFRGEHRCYDKVSSTLYRECRQVAKVDMERIQQQILNQAHAYDTNRLGPSQSQNYHFMWSGRYDPTRYTERDFEILNELQHWGGETNLIDFTTDYRVALFFACDGCHNEDGRIIIQNRGAIADIIWEPTEPRHRVEAQKSVFVHPPNGFIQPDSDKIICIPKTLKVPILKHLMRQTPPITTETIYNDLHGFIRMQSRYRSAFVKFYIALDYEEQGATAETSQGRHEAYKKAVDCYRDTIELMPNLVMAHIRCGVVHAMLEDFDSAIYNFNEAVDWKPDEVMAHNNLGSAYVCQGDLDLAIKNFDTAIKLNPDNAFAYKGRADVNFIKGKLDLAIKDYNKAIELDSNDYPTYVALGAVYHSKDLFDLAIDSFDKAVELIENHVESSEPYSNLAMNQLSRNGKTLTRKSADSIAYNNRGNAYIEKGEYDRAIADFTEAIELNSNDTNAYYNRGGAYYLKEGYESAVVDFTKVIDLNPDYAEAYNNRGVAYHLKEEYESAIADYTQAIQLKPDYAIAYNNRGRAYGVKDKVDSSINRPNSSSAKLAVVRAIKDYNPAIGLNPELAPAYYNRGTAWLCLKEWERAKSDLTAARDKGLNIITAFRNDYESVGSFEGKHGVQLPEDVIAMLL